MSHLYDKFSHFSPLWTSKTSMAGDREQESKNPGYWLSSFTKIGVMLRFPSSSPHRQGKKTVILVNNTAEPLYTAVHNGNKKTWMGGFSTMRLFPPTSIDKNCLIQGFNLQGPRSWTLKSRVGVETEPLTCTLRYWVIGIGIGFMT